jgi:3-isopropylmalate dehydrogenase
MRARIAVLPGDGIGPEVAAEAVKALKKVAHIYGHEFVFEEALIGGAAMDASGNPLPDETLQLCRESDAILLAAVGGPKWDDPAARVRPEQGLLRLRKELELFANLRPVKLYPQLLHISPIKADIVAGVDLMVVRELTGGIYFGQPRIEGDGGRAVDTMVYTAAEVERVAHVAFRLARGRRGKVTSVDKANVLACSRLWRRVVDAVAAEYRDVEYEHLLVDACTMHLIRRPTTFDVILTGNMFGDILTDEASMLAGSMGMLPSASLGGVPSRDPGAGGSPGLYEPIHGSAPDIAGQNVANPIATILSVGLLLRYSLGLADEAAAVEAAVIATLEAGCRTRDIADEGAQPVGTREMGSLIADRMANGE